MMSNQNQPNALWILFPIFFGVLGGTFAYLAVLNKNRDTAKLLLKLGGYVTVIHVVIGISALVVLIWVGTL